MQANTTVLFHNVDLIKEFGFQTICVIVQKKHYNDIDIIVLLKLWFASILS
jgi:hypothetical protein